MSFSIILKEWNFKIWTLLSLLLDKGVVVETGLSAGTWPFSAIASPTSLVLGSEFVALSNGVAFGDT